MSRGFRKFFSFAVTAFPFICSRWSGRLCPDRTSYSLSLGGLSASLFKSIPIIGFFLTYSSYLSNRRATFFVSVVNVISSDVFVHFITSLGMYLFCRGEGLLPCLWFGTYDHLGFLAFTCGLGLMTSPFLRFYYITFWRFCQGFL